MERERYIDQADSEIDIIERFTRQIQEKKIREKQDRRIRE